MSQLGLSAALLGGQRSGMADLLAQEAARSGAGYSNALRLSPQIIQQALQAIAEQRQRTGELIAQIRSDRAAQLQRALLSAGQEVGRSINDSADRATRQKIATQESNDRAKALFAELDARGNEGEKNRQNALDVANIQAGSRENVAEMRSAGGEGIGQTAQAVYRKLLEARLDGDTKKEARAVAVLQDMGRNAIKSGTPEEQQAVLNEFGAMGIRLDGAAPPADKASGDDPPGMMGKAIGYWPQAVWEGVANSSEAIGNFGANVLGVDPNKPPTPMMTVTPPSWLSQYIDPIGGAVEGAGSAVRRWLGLDQSPAGGAMRPGPAAAPKPTSMADFYRSMENLPQPTTQPVAPNPLLQQPDPWQNYNWLRPR